MANRKVTEQEARERLEKEAKKVKESDVEKVVERVDEIKKKFESKSPLGRFIKDVKLTLSLMEGVRFA